MSGQAADVDLHGEHAAAHAALVHAADQPPANEPGLAFRVQAESYMKSSIDSLQLYQLEGAAKMSEFEESPRTGGILADEAGLGTILQCLILIAAGKGKGQKSPTLIVVPNEILIGIWEHEITERTKLKTLKYHGTGRQRIDSDFDNADIVLTTYDTLLGDLPPMAHRQIETVRRKSSKSSEFCIYAFGDLREMPECLALFRQQWNRVIFDQAQ